MTEELQNTEYRIITNAKEIKKYFKKEKLLKKSEREVKKTLDGIALKFTKADLLIMKQTLSNNLTHAIARQTSLFSFVGIVVALVAILAGGNILSEINGYDPFVIIVFSYTLLIGGYFILTTIKQEKIERYTNYIEVLLSIKEGRNSI